jgi:hypothetical protein
LPQGSTRERIAKKEYNYLFFSKEKKKGRTYRIKPDVPEGKIAVSIEI